MPSTPILWRCSSRATAPPPHPESASGSPRAVPWCSTATSTPTWATSAPSSPQEARGRLARWILDLEYGLNGLPRPDVSLFLDVPFSFTEQRLAEQRAGDDRAYLRGGSDIHEDSLGLQRAVREVYLSAAREDDALRVVDCADAAGAMAAPDEVFARIVAAIEPLTANPARR